MALKNDERQYAARVKKELSGLVPVFAHAAVGDFSYDVSLINNVGPFDELYAGTQIMLDVIRGQMAELKAANIALQEAKEQTQALLSSIGDGVVALDSQGRVMFINRTAEQLTGWPSAKAMGQSWHALVTAIDIENGSVMEIDDRAHHLAFTAKKKIMQEVLYVRQDKKRFPASVTATPIYLHDKPWGVIQVFRDMTKELEAQRSAVDYISLTAHQMRSPLTVIRWTSESLLDGDDGPLSRTQLEQVRTLHGADLRMITLIGAFLNVSRLELGSFAVAPTPTDIRAVLDGVAEELAPEAARADVTFKRTYADAVPMINADPKLLQVILHNLVTNALKYGRKNGDIRLGIKTVPRAIVVSVSDDGLGISERDQPKIFSKLFRSDAVRMREIDGTGLGLYIVKTIIEKTGGRIWFESEEGKGSTFYVAIPLRGMRAQRGVKELNTMS